MDLQFSKEMIKYSDNDVQRSIVIKGRYASKVKTTMKYLEKHLPINKLSKKNTFDFSKLKFDEGKNYDWFFLESKNVQLLVRQYQLHFTIFAINRKKESYFNKPSIFTIDTDFKRLENSPENDKLSDQHWDDKFLTFETLLPLIVEKVEADEVHTLWNDLCFPTPKHTKAKAAFIGDESVYDLNTTIFAMDELGSIFGQCFAQNEILTQLKKLKVGDPFGTAYTIADIVTEVKDEYYHNVGLHYTRNDKPEEKKWADVYSLSQFYFDELFFSSHKGLINDFIEENHDTIFDEVVIELVGKRLFFSDIIYNVYYKKMHELYLKSHNAIELRDFVTFISKDYNKFLYYSFMREYKKVPIAE